MRCEPGSGDAIGTGGPHEGAGLADERALILAYCRRQLVHVCRQVLKRSSVAKLRHCKIATLGNVQHRKHGACNVAAWSM